MIAFQSRMREQEILQCAENGDIQSLRFMLLQDRDFSVNCTDMLGRTPLQLAVNNEHQEVKSFVNGACGNWVGHNIENGNDMPTA